MQALLGGTASLESLSLNDKYQILVAYKKGGGISGLIDDGDEEEGAEAETSLIEHKG